MEVLSFLLGVFGGVLIMWFIRFKQIIEIDNELMRERTQNIKLEHLFRRLYKEAQKKHIYVTDLETLMKED